MANLENILNEKNERIQKIRTSTVNALQKKKEEHDKEINKLKKDYEKNLSKLNKIYSSYIERTGIGEASFLNLLEHEYNPRLTVSLMEDLNTDYETMKQRAECTGLCKEKIDKVLKLKKSLSKMEDKEKESLNFLLENLTPEMKALLNNPNIEENTRPVNIKTYISSNGAGCYILTPIIDESANKFTKEMTDKLFGIINMRRIYFNGDKSLNFNGKEVDYANKFLMFKLETPQPADLATALVNKLNDDHIQPPSFKEGNMVHRAIHLDYNILKNFMNYAESIVGESEVKVSGKRGPYKKKSEKNLETSVVSQEPQDKKKYAHFKISKYYDDPQKVINLYNQINNEFREKNGKDMLITGLTKIEKVGEKSGWTFYGSLIKHIGNGTINIEDIHSSSNLEEYVGEGRSKPKESKEYSPAIEVNASNPKYIELKSECDSLIKKYGPLSRTRASQVSRSFYDRMREAEKDGINIDFLPARAQYRLKKDKKKE